MILYNAHQILTWVLFVCLCVCIIYLKFWSMGMTVIALDIGRLV